MSAAPTDAVPFMDLATHHRAVAPRIFDALRCLVDESDFIGGERLRHFEREFASFAGTAHAVGVSNGTDALTLALRAAGVGRGDEVITVSLTFIATIEAILAIGAMPVLVDVDPTTGLMDLDQAEAAITSRTRAIVPVHLYGNVVDLDRLERLCQARGLLLLQDAAQAHGARWTDRPLGAFGDAQTYSFYPGKNLGAWGDAGCLTTSRADLAERVRAQRDHGRRSNEKYVHHELGGNYRMDPLQAVVLSTKLPLLERGNATRRALYNRYRHLLAGVGDLELIRIEPAATPVYHLAVVQTDSRDALRAHLAARKISTGIHYPIPVHQQPALAELLPPSSLPVTERLAVRVLSLPLYPELTERQHDRVVEAIREFFS